MFDASDKSLIKPAYSPNSTDRIVRQFEAVGFTGIVDADISAPNGFQLFIIGPGALSGGATLAMSVGILLDEIPVTPLLAAGARRPLYNFVFFGPAKARIATGSPNITAGDYIKPWDLGGVYKSSIGNMSLGRAMANGVAGDLIDVFVNPASALY